LTGDLGELPVPDGSADVVLALWALGSVMPAMGQVLADYLPPPRPSSGSPNSWGAAAIAGLLEPCGLRLTEVLTERVDLQCSNARAGAWLLIRTARHVVREQELSADGR